jgi:drug/metabolite transporter (DMT)-like permease
VLLLMWLIRHGEAGKVASLFYLVPAFTAVEAWLLFGEQFGLIAIAGIACCIIGVALVIREPRAP